MIPSLAQWVKDSVLPEQWCRLQSWLGSDTWSENSIYCRIAKKKKKALGEVGTQNGHLMVLMNYFLNYDAIAIAF